MRHSPGTSRTLPGRAYERDGQRPNQRNAELHIRLRTNSSWRKNLLLGTRPAYSARNRHFLSRRFQSTHALCSENLTLCQSVTLFLPFVRTVSQRVSHEAHALRPRKKKVHTLAAIDRPHLGVSAGEQCTHEQGLADQGLQKWQRVSSEFPRCQHAPTRPHPRDGGAMHCPSLVN